MPPRKPSGTGAESAEGNNRNESAAKAAAGAGSVSENWDELADQLDRLRADVSAVSNSFQNLAKAGVSEGRERVGDQIDELARRTREMSDELQARGRRSAREVSDQASAMTREVEATIVRNPLTAMLVALGLGYIVGLTSRSRS